jgi:hypothetical protein
MWVLIQNFNYIEDSGKYGFDFLSAISGLGKYKLRLEVCYITNDGKISSISRMMIEVVFVVLWSCSAYQMILNRGNFLPSNGQSSGNLFVIVDGEFV